MLAETVLSAQELRTLWHQLGQDESLTEPYELTEHGEIVMGPCPTNRHQVVAKLIADQLQSDGNCSDDGHCRRARARRRVDATSALAPAGVDPVEAPELVVEVLSPGNRKAQVLHKVQAYLMSGVQEVVVVGLADNIDYHHQDGQHAQSALGLTLAVPPEFTS